MEEGLVIVCGSTLFFGTMLLIILGFFAYIRYIRYQETMKLAEKGLVKPVSTSSGKGTLVWGVVITALGLALCLGLYPIGWLVADGEFPLNFGPWMLIGLVPTFFGLALVLIYALTAERKKKVEEPSYNLNTEVID
ncbi:MAG: hypothetical protein EHM41_07115 [Chloroflexi bacterium]|nr:MAG: hypothetical protein EHM41_07115 [Chloroflexota bacterium]